MTRYRVRKGTIATRTTGELLVGGTIFEPTPLELVQNREVLDAVDGDPSPTSTLERTIIELTGDEPAAT